MERQKVANEYRSMMVDGMDLTPLELNLYKGDPVVISHIIHMITGFYPKFKNPSDLVLM